MSHPIKPDAKTSTRDIVIIGAGPAGLSLACALSKSGLSITIIDKQSKEQIEEPEFDGRDIAMTHRSRNILESFNVWSKLEQEHIHPLREATVQDGDSAYALQFERSDDINAPLGYLVANYRIRKALYDQACQLENVHFIFNQAVKSLRNDSTGAEVSFAQGEKINTRLVVAADSRFSEARRMMGIGAKMRDYGRIMIVCNMRHEENHNNIAQECFRYGRTCAILPLAQGESSIVITVSAAKASSLVELSAEQFSSAVEDMLDYRLGKMSLISERKSYPLTGVYSDRFIAQRCALIGDAAVGMHPVTAHGYNLGLRSADTLASQIKKAAENSLDIGSNKALHLYEVRHQMLARPLYDATNFIVRLYTNDSPLAKLARKVSLRAGNHFTPFKKLITHRLTQTS